MFKAQNKIKYKSYARTEDTINICSTDFIAYSYGRVVTHD